MKNDNLPSSGSKQRCKMVSNIMMIVINAMLNLEHKSILSKHKALQICLSAIDE